MIEVSVRPGEWKLLDQFHLNFIVEIAEQGSTVTSWTASGHVLSQNPQLGRQISDCPSMRDAQVGIIFVASNNDPLSRHTRKLKKSLSFLYARTCYKLAPSPHC